MKLRRLTLLSLCAIALPAFAAPPSDLDAFANRALKTFGAPGMGVAIVEGDRAIAIRSARP